MENAGGEGGRRRISSGARVISFGRPANAPRRAGDEGRRGSQSIKNITQGCSVWAPPPSRSELSPSLGCRRPTDRYVYRWLLSPFCLFVCFFFCFVFLLLMCVRKPITSAAAAAAAIRDNGVWVWTRGLVQRSEIMDAGKKGDPGCGND